MSERDALLAAIYANPADDTPRLVYADWLDDHDEHDRAAFTRCPHLTRHRRESYGRWVWAWQNSKLEVKYWHPGVYTGMWPATELFALPVSIRRKVNEYTFRHGFVTSVSLAAPNNAHATGRLSLTLKQIGIHCRAIERIRLEGAIHLREYGGGGDRWAVYRFQIGPVWDILCPDAAQPVGAGPHDVFAEHTDQDQLDTWLATAAALYARGESARRPSETVT